MKSFMDEMREWKKDLSNSSPEERAYYKRVEDFVRSGTYSTYKQATYLVDLCLAGRTIKEISERINVQEPSIRYYKSSLLSQPLYKIFGNDFFDLVRLFSDQETRKVLLKRLYMAETMNAHRETYCSYDVIDKTSGIQVNYSEYNLKDCLKEVQFLKNFNKKKIQSALDKLDPYKLEYLLSIIDGTCGSKEDRYSLIYIMEKENQENLDD